MHDGDYSRGTPSERLLEGPEALFAWLFDSPPHAFAAMCIRGRASYQRRASITEDAGLFKRIAGVMILVFATMFAVPQNERMRQLITALRGCRGAIRNSRRRIR